MKLTRNKSGKIQCPKWRRWQYILAVGYLAFLGFFGACSFYYKSDLPTFVYVAEFVIFLIMVLSFTFLEEKDKKTITNQGNQQQ